MSTSVVNAAASTAAPTTVNEAFDAMPVVTEAPETDVSETQQTPPPEMDGVDAPEETQNEADQPVQPETEEELDAADPLDPDKIDGKQYHFREAKAKQLLAARDLKNALEQAIGPDAANVEYIKSAVERGVEIDRLVADFDSGNPERVGNVVEFLLTKSQNPSGGEVFADQMMAALATKQPEVYSKISARVISGYTNHLYELAARQGDAKLFKLAQNLDYRMNNRFRPDAAMQAQPADPLQNERQRFEQERQQFYQLRQQEQTSYVQKQVAETESAVEGAIKSEIEKALAPVVEQWKALTTGEISLKHAQRDLREAVEEAFGANSIQQSRYNNLIDRYKLNPTAETKEQIVTMMRQFAAPVIAKQKKAVIAAVSGNVLEKNAALHAKLQQTSKRQELTGTNPSRPPNINQKLADMKAKGMDARAGIEALFGER